MIDDKARLKDVPPIVTHELVELTIDRATEAAPAVYTKSKLLKAYKVVGETARPVLALCHELDRLAGRSWWLTAAWTLGYADGSYGASEGGRVIRLHIMFGHARGGRPDIETVQKIFGQGTNQCKEQFYEEATTFERIIPSLHVQVNENGQFVWVDEGRTDAELPVDYELHVEYKFGEKTIPLACVFKIPVRREDLDWFKEPGISSSDLKPLKRTKSGKTKFWSVSLPIDANLTRGSG